MSHAAGSKLFVLDREVDPKAWGKSRVCAVQIARSVVLHCLLPVGVSWKSMLSEYRKSLNSLEILLSRR